MCFLSIASEQLMKGLVQTMTLDEKLDNFFTSAIDSATNQNIETISEYKQSLQNIFDDRKQAALRKAESSFQVESVNIIREKNRKLSSETVDMKRRVNEKTAELTDKVFKDVEKQLEIFMKTSSYDELLITQITVAHEFARGDEITIYINPSDENRKATLEAKTGVALTISTRDFIGGIRAVIHASNILIDHSFLTKLADAKNSFTL